MFENVKAFANDDSGASAVEYALLVAGVGIAVAGMLGTLSTQLGGAFENLADQLNWSKNDGFSPHNGSPGNSGQ